MECKLTVKENAVGIAPDDMLGVPALQVYNAEGALTHIYLKEDGVWSVEQNDVFNPGQEHVDLALELFSEHLHAHAPKQQEKKPTNTAYENLLADYERLKARSQKDTADAVYAAQNEMLAPLFDTLDGLDNLITSLQSVAMAAETKQSIVEGVSLLARGYESQLKKYGVEPIVALGEQADPQYHKVIAAIPSNEAPGTIVSQIKRGYTRDGTLIRPSEVVVAAK